MRVFFPHAIRDSQAKNVCGTPSILSEQVPGVPAENGSLFGFAQVRVPYLLKEGTKIGELLLFRV